MRMIFKHKDQEVARNIKMADTFLSRAIGLMFKSEMPDYDGILIKPSNSIHTFWMKFSIDVIFLNKELEVIKVFENLKPWRMTLPYLRANQVLELRAGTLNGRIKKGDHLEMTCTN